MGLASAMENLVGDIGRARCKRSSDVTTLRQRARVVVQGLGHARREGATRLRDVLRVSRARLSSETGSSMIRLRVSRAKLSSETRSSMIRYKSLRTEKAKGDRDARRSGLRARRTMVVDALCRCGETRKELQQDLKKADAVWRSIARQGVGPSVSLGAVTAAPGLTAAVSAEEPGAAGYADLDDRVLAVVRENPDGSTLAGMADRIGLHSVAVSRHVKNLTERGLIFKQDKLYYPAPVAGAEGEDGK